MGAHDAALALHPLAFLPEDGEVVIGRTDINSFAVFPSTGAALLRRMCAGEAPTDAASWYRERYGEDVDLDAFVATLRDLDFICERGEAADVATPGPALPATPEAVRWQRLGRALFSPVAWAGYVALVAGALLVLMHMPALLPGPQHILFSDYRVIVLATIIAGQIPLVLIHECFHALAARRLGVNASIKVSHRLYFVVFECVLDGLVVVPRSKRYLPILAGMLADVLIIAALIIVAGLTSASAGHPGALSGACLALAFATLLRLGWQLCIFMRTDVYYLLTTAARCDDLDATARQLIRNRIGALRGRMDGLFDESAWNPRDRQVARWYVPLMLAGYAAAIGILVVGIAPLVWAVVGGAAQAIVDHQGHPAHLWDSAAVLALNVAQLAAAAFIGVRERRRHAGR